MNKLKYQGLISSTKTSQSDIQQLALSFEKSSINQLFDLLLFLHHCLTHPAEPLSQLHSVLSLSQLLKKPKYPLVVIVEQVFLQVLKEPALASASNVNSKSYDYFQNLNFRSNEGSLQQISYNFTKTCMEVCLMVGYIKPRRLYRNRECSSESIGKKIVRQLKDGGLSEEQNQRIAIKLNFINLRKIFVSNIIEFHKSPHQYIDYFMQKMEQFLLNEVKCSQFQWFRSLCKEGDVYLTSEALARLAQVLSFHKKFSVRRIALQLITDFLLWGDLQALLLINYTEYFALIGTKIVQAENRKKKTGVFCFFPEIDGQNRQKQLFLKQFLLLILRMATIFPSLDSYFVDSGQAPIYQLYIRLLEHKVVFPSWQGQQHFQLRILKNFRQRKEHNDHFLQQLDKQKNDGNFKMNPLRPTFQHIQNYINKNQHNLQILLKQRDFHSKQWQQLVQFKKHFQQYLQRMVVGPDDQQLQKLLQQGIQLQQIIQSIEDSHNELRQGNINLQEFYQRIQKNNLKQKADYSQKISSIKQSIRLRDKDSLRYSLTHSAEIVKDKLSAKVMKLAKKRSQIVGQVSQLQLYSRPFVANNIHGKEIISQFVPILQLHPQRKDKRMRGGLKLMGRKQQMTENKFGNTPRFKSLVEPRSFVNGPQIIEHNNHLQKYLFFLDNSIRLNNLKPSEKINKKGQLSIKRGQLVKKNNQIEMNIHICYPNKIKALSFNIIEQPSVKIQKQFSIQNQSQAKLIIRAQLLKFGYDLPAITFLVDKKQEISFQLPFSFHNFITFSSQKIENTNYHQEWITSDPIKPQFRNEPSSFKDYLAGMTKEGKAQLGIWACNYSVGIQGDKLLVKIDTSQSQNDNILQQILPRLMARMFTSWNS